MTKASQSWLFHRGNDEDGAWSYVTAHGRLVRSLRRCREAELVVTASAWEASRALQKLTTTPGLLPSPLAYAQARQMLKVSRLWRRLPYSVMLPV